MTFDPIPFLLLAFLIETLVQVLSWVIGEKNNVANWLATNIPMWKRILALVSGPVLAVLMNVDLFVALGFPLVVGVVGPIVTGLLLARGATIIHDLTTIIRPAV